MFDDRDRHATTPAREVALSCLAAGIQATQPTELVAEHVTLDGERLEIDDSAYYLCEYDRVLVLGGGKAADGLATALEGVLDGSVDGGIVVTTADDAATSPTGTGEGGIDETTGDDDTDVGRIEIVPGSHPIPTERNVTATRRILHLADEAGPETLVLAVVTGGASALLAAPANGLDVAALQETTTALLESGASIAELNAVRKHCSAIKGGRLAERVAPATVITLAISDVVGDDPAVVASGPTVPDPTSYGDALAVLDRYDVRERVPDEVIAYLIDGADGAVPETPTAGELATDETDWHCLGTNRTAIDAARRVAVVEGYDPLVLSSRVQGEASEAGRFHAAVAAESALHGEPVRPPAVLLSGGEVTVAVTGDGTGGPNQELALGAALELAEQGRAESAVGDGGQGGDRPEIVLASVDTDGIDGPTDAAGAIVDSRTVTGDPATARDALTANDAGRFLDERSALLRTGKTGTNVNDLRVIVIDGRD